ncbi:MAG: glycerophosphodiester phosphodiesterase [Natrialbaceae archaeon]|nr:glycerophosphodiester phosphodiesterase [Natrialbaceae archaeon]
MTDPAVIAHRGYAGIGPENTIAGVERAASYEATAMIEIDVQPAACGTPVVFHDHQLDGQRNGTPITDAAGTIWETELEMITSAEVLGSGETVPTLAGLLEAVPPSIGLNVELKNPGTGDIRMRYPLERSERVERRELWSPFVEAVVADLDRFGGDVILSSFCEGALLAARDVAPLYPRAPILWGDIETGRSVAQRLSCDGLHPRQTAVGPDDLVAAQDEGLDVNVWTVDSIEQYDQLVRLGVDGIVSDYPLAALE